MLAEFCASPLFEELAFSAHLQHGTSWNRTNHHPTKHPYQRQQAQLHIMCGRALTAVRCPFQGRAAAWKGLREPMQSSEMRTWACCYFSHLDAKKSRGRFLAPKRNGESIFLGSRPKAPPLFLVVLLGDFLRWPRPSGGLRAGCPVLLALWLLCRFGLQVTSSNRAKLGSSRVHTMIRK